MKKRFVSFLIIFLGLLFISSLSSPGRNEKAQNIKGPDLIAEPQCNRAAGMVKPDINFGKIPLYFITNKGQVNEKAVFYAKASRYTLWLTKEGLVFDSTRTVAKGDTPRPSGAPLSRGETHPAPLGHLSQEKHTPSALRGHPSQEGSNRLTHSPYSTHSPKPERDVSRLIFLNANKNPGIVPMDEAKLRVNYFIGNDKSKWNCDIPTSQAVLYKNLYKNIDLKVYGIEKQIEYDWIIKPGGNPGDIKFEYKNVKGSRIDNEGNLLIETGFGELLHKRPVSYQKRKAQSAERTAQNEGVGAGLRACPGDNEREEIIVKFKKMGKNTYGFAVGQYDKTRELVIDPVVLAYSTYLGGGDFDTCTGIAVDNSGNAYVTGYTSSSDFPILDQFQGYPGYYNNVFVTRIDTNQSGVSSLIYSTYLGGVDEDSSSGIAVDGAGNAYITGSTCSSDFPILNQYQGYLASLGDAFVTRLDTNQSGAASLIYSTYLGGSGTDHGRGIAVDSSGNTYVTGVTYSTDFPIFNQYQGYLASQYDAFVTRLDTNQSGAAGLIYSTYLGGGNGDSGNGIAVDDSGNVFVIGNTSSTDFPNLNQYQGYQGLGDSFVTRLNTNQSGASSLIYSSYLGGTGEEYGHGIAVDGIGNAYVTGWTYSTDFPTLNQYQGYPGDSCLNAFITRLDTNQSGVSSFIYSTYLGGGGHDGGFDIAVVGSGTVYVTGVTTSANFPIFHQYQGFQGSDDVFVTRLDTNESGTTSLIYSTYLGGGFHDQGWSIAVDGSGNAYVTGYTESTNFPTFHQYQQDQDGYGVSDAFVTKLVYAVLPTVSTAAVSSITYNSAVSGGNVIDDGGDPVTARGVCWCISSNPTLADNYSIDGTGTGVFTSSMTELASDMLYYVRAYATNSVGTVYGNQLTFTTLSTPPCIPAVEREALIALYNNTAGDNWINNSGWKTPPLAGDGFALPGTENTWHGITCNTGNTTVQSIFLSENNLIGILPPELGNLANLQELWLSFNQLSGSIPPELGNLANLQYLMLTYNKLSGGIPPELGNLDNLHILNLGSNELSGGIPPGLGSLANLNDLSLFSNRLSGSIPPELGNLGNLSSLSLGDNSLIGNIPPELGNLANLTWLILGNNQLSGSIPPELGNLAKLTTLTLSNNQISGSIPPELGNLDKLTWLIISNNQLSGSIPPELGNLANLQYLHLWGNQFSGSIPQELGNLANLNSLCLNNNQLSGSIPPELGNLDNLQSLNLNSNQLSGSIPPELGNPDKLYLLDLCSNSLSGSIPPELGNLVNLQYLKLSSNRLSGSIPSNLINLTNLVNDCSNLKWNALYTNDDILRDFLTSKQREGNWENTQTIAPADVTAASLSGASIDIDWTPISYTGDTGGYRVLYSTTPGGPHTYFGMTADKTGSSLTVTGLNPDTTYYFVVQTRTDPHANNQDTVDSEYSTEVSATTKNIWLNSPNGGENLSPGSTFLITWGDSESFDFVSLEYSVDNGGTWMEIVSSAANNGGYNWTVPGTPSDDCLVRVRATDEDEGPSDVSDAVFSIDAAPGIIVTSPNGGENLTAGSFHEITWLSSGDINDIFIYYSTDRGASWTPIAESTANSGSYNWTVPDTPAEDCLVRISGGDADESPSDISNTVFSILPASSPTLIVTFPNGGERLTTGLNYEITWSTIGILGNVKIEYSSDNGVSWTTAVEATANTGSYNWTVPDTPSDNCLVRVSDGSGAVFDVSDAVFALVLPPTITVTSPNGGESLEVGSSHEITWTSTGTVGCIMIEYSPDSGTTWTTIETSASNEGSYNWMVPDTPADTCLIRISGCDCDDAPSDTSDAVFSISGA